MKRSIIKIIFFISLIYCGICTYFYLNQESFIFHGKKLAKNYDFQFGNEFEEFNLRTSDKKNINAVIFKSKNPKGLLFYCHGNAGNIETWSEIAKIYTQQNFDVCLLDYRGFGKSEGQIFSEEQFVSDGLLVFDYLKKKYQGKRILVLGYSIGTFLATKIAENNKIETLILQAPYTNLRDLMAYKFSFLPRFMLKYEFDTEKIISKIDAKISLFHGKNDGLIPYSHSEKLAKKLKLQDDFFLLKNVGHNSISQNEKYLQEIKLLLD